MKDGFVWKEKPIAGKSTRTNAWKYQPTTWIAIHSV